MKWFLAALGVCSLAFAQPVHRLGLHYGLLQTSVGEVAGETPIEPITSSALVNWTLELFPDSSSRRGTVVVGVEGWIREAIRFDGVGDARPFRGLGLQMPLLFRTYDQECRAFIGSGLVNSIYLYRRDLFHATTTQRPVYALGVAFEAGYTILPDIGNVQVTTRFTVDVLGGIQSSVFHIGVAYGLGKRFYPQSH